MRSASIVEALARANRRGPATAHAGERQVAESRSAEPGITGAARPGMSRVACLLLLASACSASPDDDALDQLVANAPANPETLTGDYCPNITGTGVTTYRGLLGNFRRAGTQVTGEPTQIYFAPVHDDPDATGWYYSGFRAGTFRAIPDNPAIGAALAIDTDGKLDQTFFVLGLARTTTTVTVLCLVGANHPFEIDRSLY